MAIKTKYFDLKTFDVDLTKCQMPDSQVILWLPANAHQEAHLAYTECKAYKLGQYLLVEMDEQYINAGKFELRAFTEHEENLLGKKLDVYFALHWSP